MPPPRQGLWRSYLLGALVIVLATGGAAAGITLEEVGRITNALKQSPQLKLGAALTPAQAGAPRTILLIGSDKRAKGAGIDAASPPHSDTLMLARLDPNQPATTLMSIPRDLKVTIQLPHGGNSTQKINAAYSIGGPKLTVETVRRVLGVRINHVVDINFLGFREAVNAIGCVYVDVDRRYFNDNSTALPGQGFATIDIQPGYQRLCGQQALDYVRYRHTDSDFVRGARQQDFLRQAKNQIGVGGLISRRDVLERIFGRYAQTDVRSTRDVLELLNLLAFSAGHPVRQIQFPAKAGPSYVTATPADLSLAAYELMHGGVGPGSHQAPAPAPPPRRRGRPSRGHRAAPVPGLTSGNSIDMVNARAASHNVPFPLWFSSREVQYQPAPSAFRTYLIRDPAGHLHHAYRVVVPEGLVGDYYGIEGMDWPNPPILQSPNGSQRVGGRTLQLYFDGQHLHLVAWHSGSAVYWVSNTLTETLSNRQMLAIAAGARPVR